MTTNTQRMKKINAFIEALFSEHGSESLLKTWHMDKCPQKLATLCDEHPNVAMVFITGNCRRYRDIFDKNPRIWQGQLHHRRDHIVSDKTNTVHVFWREKGGTPFTYLGTIDNSSFVLKKRGNAAKGKPNTYSFSIIRDDERSGRVANKPLEGETTWDFHETAAASLGLKLLDHNTSWPQGIYNCDKID